MSGFHSAGWFASTRRPGVSILSDFIIDDCARRYCGTDFAKAVEAIRGRLAQAGDDTGDPVMAACWEINV